MLSKRQQRWKHEHNYRDTKYIDLDIVFDMVHQAIALHHIKWLQSHLIAHLFCTEL